MTNSPHQWGEHGLLSHILLFLLLSDMKVMLPTCFFLPKKGCKLLAARAMSMNLLVNYDFVILNAL